mmetsp:Transcript_42302/g.99323  ORF Transcript_42302/g.99323 Transcript_42302/m.99323 type:complete len:583 (-) Transcript_42302:282-2030(-)
MADFDSPEVVIKKVKIRDSFAGDALKDNFGARFSEGGGLILTPTKDTFLLRASHNVQAPHNYNPVHEHNTRYRDWYHTNFAVDTETEYRKKKRRGGAAADSDDGGCKCLLLTLLVLLVAIWLGYMMAFGSGDGNVGSSLLSRDDVNETAVAELRRLFESLDEEHGRTKGQLDSLNARVQEDALALQIAALREELGSLSKRFHGALEQQEELLDSHGALSAELKAVHKQSLAATPQTADAGLQAQLEQIKGEVKDLVAGLKAAQDQTKKTEDKTLSVAGVSKEVKNAVAQSVAGLLQNHTLLQQCAGKDEGCTPGFKAKVVEDVKKLVFQDLSQSSEELVDKYVQKSVWEAVAGYDGEGKKSELEGSIKGVLKAVYEENLGGVDWMLSINGAEIGDHSPSFDPCREKSGMAAMMCHAEQAINKPLQLSAETIIKTDATQGGQMGEQWTQLGHCWAMSGTRGFVEVRLDRPVEPTGFVVEHAPSRLSIQGGSSAPRKFTVKGWLSGDLEAQTLVEGEYSIATAGFNAHIQRFPIIPAQDGAVQQVDRVRVEIESNHGDARFTCLYHLRLYAKLPPLPVLHKSAK